MSKKAFLFLFGLVFFMGCSNLPTATPISAASPDADIPPIVDPQELTFSEQDLHTTTPDDVLEEVFYYGGGGGGDDLDYCHNETTPTLVLGLTEMTQAEYLFINPIIVTCGWEEGEQVTVTVVGIDGTQAVETWTARAEHNIDDGSVTGYYVDLESISLNVPASGPDLDRYALHGIPVGVYRIRFEGQSGRVDADLRVTPATSGQAKKDVNGGIYLFGFAADDRVRVFYYTETGPPVWQEYELNPSGELWISGIPDDIDAYAIFSQETGYITTLNIHSFGATAALKCGNALPTRTRPGEFLRLANFLRGEGLKLHASPDASSPITDYFPYENPQRAFVRTISLPVCAGDATWWKVQTLENQIGWTIESNEQDYFLIDYGLIGAHPEACETFSDMVVGDVGRVTFTDGAPLRMHQSPDLSAPIVNKIPEGTRFVIEEGPQCGLEGALWWFIETDDGSNGWVINSINGIDYLEPWK